MPARARGLSSALRGGSRVQGHEGMGETVSTPRPRGLPMLRTMISCGAGVRVRVCVHVHACGVAAETECCVHARVRARGSAAGGRGGPRPPFARRTRPSPALGVTTLPERSPLGHKGRIL